MKHILVLAAALTSISTYAAPGYTPGQYAVDPMHSKVGFEVPHLVISTVEGRFNEFSGQLNLTPDLKNASVEVSINAASIDTGIAKRDGHLKSADFFDVEKNPTLTFKSKKITGSLDKLKIVGDLTMKGVTKEVTLDGKYLGSVKDGYGNLKAAFEATTKVNRKDFGLTWNSMVEAGPVVGDDIKISLKIQAAKTEAKHAAAK